MTSADYQAQINANAQEQAYVLAGSSYDKLERLRKLQATQTALYRQRDAAKRAEEGRAPRERAGVGY
jgi:hypothetical protein